MPSPPFGHALGNSPDLTQSLFYFSVVAKGELGKLSEADNEFIKTGDLYVYGAETTLGMKECAVLVGETAEYNTWLQKTKTSEVSNTITSGRQLSLTLIIGVAFGNFLLQTRPYLSSTLTM